jgi:hypothetical protein
MRTQKERPRNTNQSQFFLSLFTWFGGTKSKYPESRWKVSGEAPGGLAHTLGGMGRIERKNEIIT